MSDVTEFPIWASGGGGGYFGGSAARGLPAMSADQINASMGFNPNAAQFDPLANSPGGFGAQTDYYSGLGAAYGRDTGGFNASPRPPDRPGRKGGWLSRALDPLPDQTRSSRRRLRTTSDGGIGCDAAAEPYQNPYRAASAATRSVSPTQCPNDPGDG